MMGVILDLLNELGSRLGRGLVRRLRTLSSRAKTVLGVAALFLMVGIRYPDLLLNIAIQCRRWVMVSVDRSSIPLRGQDRQRIDALIQHLGELIYTAYTKQFESSPERTVQIFGPWDAAQMAVALSGLNLPNRAPINRERILSYFQETRSSQCGPAGGYCWRESERVDGEERAHVAVSSWVMFAKARLGVAAEPLELKFLLLQQHPVAGSWPIFPCKETTAGSVYSTSWALMALGEQVRRGLIQEPWLSDVRNSMRSGLSWLESRQSEKGLWRSYPEKSWSNEISISNSGLALHVLHSFETERFKGVERTWMRELSGERPPAYKAETFNSWVCGGDNFEREYTRYLVLPWEFVATVDAYSNGDIPDQARALELIEKTARADEEISGEIKQEYFLGAELLIALRHLRESFLAAEPGDIWSSSTETHG